MASGDARPVPRKNAAFRVTFPILDADGDLVSGATGLDSEVSIDGGTFADCTNEATEIATNSGMYYLDLTSGEMNGDTVAVIVKTSTSGAKTTTLVMYPEEAGDFRVDVTHWGGTAVASANVLIDGAITAAKIASNAITDAKIASGALTSAKFAAGAFDAVWSVATRLLTAGTNIVLAKGTGVTGFNDLDAAGVRTAVGLASANLDTQLGDIPNNSEFNARTLASADYATSTALGTVDTVVDGIKAVTDNLPDSGALTSIARGSDLATVAGYIDTEITTLQGTADNIEADTQDIQNTLAALSIPTANENADALLDRANAIENGLTVRQSMRLQSAALAGKVSGAGTNTNTFRNAVADSKDRITATVDVNGNRTAITTDVT